MTSPLHVLILGTGELGTYLGEEFARHGDKVSFGTRLTGTDKKKQEQWSKKDVEIRKIDYSSASSIRMAIKGIDVIISALVFLPQIDIEVAKVAAKEDDVRLFIPSMFGFDYTLPVMHDPRTSLALIVEKFASLTSIDKTGIDWLAISTQLFSTFSLMPLFGINVKRREISWSGSSDQTVSMSHPKDIASFTRLVVQRRLEDSRARRKGEKIWYYMESFQCTFSKVFEEIQRLDKKNKSWSITFSSMEEAQSQRRVDFGAWLKCVFDEGLASRASNDHSLVNFTPEYSFQRAIQEAFVQHSQPDI